MKIHKCYFCNYQTRQKSSLRDHVMKQKKCSYVIYPTTINSIEDYYKLVDLHKNDPDNIIFGGDPNEPPPKFYESDDNENLDSEDKETLERNKKYVESVIQEHLNKKNIHQCNYCRNIFSRKDHLKRHLNGRCKILKKIKKKEEIKLKQEEFEEEIQYQETIKTLENTPLGEQIMLMKKLMEKQMEKQIEKQMEKQEEKNKKIEEKFKTQEKEIQELKKTKNNHTINNINNIEEQNNTENIETNIETNIEEQNNIKTNIEKVENNFVINNFGYENTEIFDEEERMISYIIKPFNALPNMIEKLHFTPSKRPENTNIRINNISNGKSQIYKYKWITIMKHDLIFDLFKINAERLIYTYEAYLEEGKIKRLSWIEKFKRQFDNNDKYFYKSQQEKIDCKLIDCMKKNKSYMNGLE